MNFKNPIIISVLVMLILYIILYKMTVDDPESKYTIGYDQTTFMYTLLSGAFIYLGMNSLLSTSTTTLPDKPDIQPTTTKIVNGEHIMVAPYST